MIPFSIEERLVNRNSVFLIVTTYRVFGLAVYVKEKLRYV